MADPSEAAIEIVSDHRGGRWNHRWNAAAGIDGSGRRGCGETCGRSGRIRDGPGGSPHTALGLKTLDVLAGDVTSVAVEPAFANGTPLVGSPFKILYVGFTIGRGVRIQDGATTWARSRRPPAAPAGVFVVR